MSLNCCFLPFTCCCVLLVAASESRGDHLLIETDYLGELIESMHCLEVLAVAYKRTCMLVLPYISTSSEVIL